MPVVPVRSLRRIVSRINVSFLVSLLSLSPSHPLTFHFSPQPALCIRQFWRIWWRVSVRSLRRIVSGINVSFLVSLPSLSLEGRAGEGLSQKQRKSTAFFAFMQYFCTIIDAESQKFT